MKKIIDLFNKSIFKIDKEIPKEDYEIIVKIFEEFIMRSEIKIKNSYQVLSQLINYLYSLTSSELRIIDKEYKLFFEIIFNPSSEYYLPMLATINPQKFNEYFDFYDYFARMFRVFKRNFSRLDSLIYLNESRLKKYVFLFKNSIGYRYLQYDDNICEFLIYIFSIYYYNDDYNGLAAYIRKFKNDLDYYDDLINIYQDHRVVYEYSKYKEKRIMQ